MGTLEGLEDTGDWEGFAVGNRVGKVGCGVVGNEVGFSVEGSSVGSTVGSKVVGAVGNNVVG